jgi:hypothetical protein
LTDRDEPFEAEIDEHPGADMSSSPWPYRSYVDRRWLGGEHGADRALSAVVRAVRSCAAAAGDPVSEEPASLLDALAHLAAIGERVDWAMLSLVGEARTKGVSWSALGASLGVTKQAAQQRFAPYVRQALEQAPEQAPPRADVLSPGADTASRSAGRTSP